MKLTVRIVASESLPGGRGLALCTEDGKMLPMQTNCKVETEVGEIGLLHVTFYIDGEEIYFANNDPW